MRKTFTLLFLLISFNSFSKANFEKGYIVNNQGVRTECLIDNGYWENTPQKFNYKIDEEILTANLKQIKSFEIYNYGKFEKQIVKIAKNQYKIEEESIWEIDTLFMQVLIQGDPSLYSYNEGSNYIFFFKKTGDSTLVQLKYKERLINSEVQKSRTYRNQISLLAGNCKNLSSNAISRLEYSADDLKSAFEEINKCQNGHFENYKPQKKTLFYLSMCGSAGITSNNISITGLNNYYSGAFDNHSSNRTGYRIGASIELRSPVYFQNWSVLFEPAFQNVASNRVIAGENVWIYQRREVETNLGLRRYFTLSNKLKLFVDATVNLKNIYFGTSLKYNYIYPVSKIEVPLYDLDIKSIQPLANSITLGAGLSYKRFGFEAKYNIPHNIATLNQEMWKIKFSNIQAIAIVRIF